MEPSQSLSFIPYPYIIPSNVNLKISLSQEESRLFSFMTKKYTELKSLSSFFPLRVAGGWVRDRILGSSSSNAYDIDIVVANGAGKDFLSLLYDHCNEEEKGEIKIMKNENQKSEKLRTGRAKIFNFDIDIVNLRKETYNASSRIPDIEEGTLLDDANRRDITINSLYYNINENKIEDVLGRSIDDLKLGLIVTNKPSTESFSEDPLRMLRVLRFAVRMQFKVRDDILNSIQLTKEFKTKLSFSRIEKEISLILQEKYGYWAIQHLYEKEILQYILNSENNEQVKNINYIVGINSLILSYVIPQLFVPLKNFDFPTKKDRGLFNLCCLLLGFRSIMVGSGKTKAKSYSRYILEDILKLPKSEVNYVMEILENVDCYVTFLEEGKMTRKDAGRLIRKLHFSSLKLYTLLSISILLSKISSKNYSENIDIIRKHPENDEKLNDILKNIFIIHEKFLNFVLEQKLENVENLKTPIGYKEIIDIIGKNNKNKVKYFIEKIMDLCLEDPNCSNEECIKWVNENKGYMG